MKKYLLLITGICLLFSSCAVPITYFGDRLTPTNSVEIYYSAHDVKHEYKVIGHLTCQNFANQDEVKQKLSDYAKKIGADAVVILGTDNSKNDQAAIVTADALKYTDK
jgi:5,10-methylenetetrahydrofolate reductase